MRLWCDEGIGREGLVLEFIDGDSISEMVGIGRENHFLNRDTMSFSQECSACRVGCFYCLL